MAKDKITDEQLNRLAEINRELDKRTNRTKKYIELEREALSLQKGQAKLEKTMESIRSSEEGVQRRINSAIKDREGSITSILKSAVKMDLSSASELLNKRKIAGESKKLANSQDDLAATLANDVKLGKISVTDRAKILKIQDGISSGKIKENDIGGKLQGLSGKGLKNSKLYGQQLKGQAGTQKNIGGLISKSSGGLAKWGARLGVFGAIAAGAYKLLTQFSAKVDAIGGTFGFLANKNEDFRDGLLLAGNNATMIGKNLSDVLAVTSQLSSEFGITLTEADDLSTKVLDTAVATGLSNDEATKLFGTFMQIGDLSAKQAEDLIESTAQLAAQRGVAPRAVLQDMAGSAEEIASFTKGTGENIAEAAVQARQLGLSLSTTAKISDSLLDFQTSIAAEVSASVMIGRRLNFQSARRLALEGDIAGATKEVVKQLGSEEELNNMNVYQRRSIAKSIGVSVSEMTKLVRGQEKLTLSTALAGKNFDDLVGEDALSTLTAITNSIKAIGAQLLDEFGRPIADALKVFTGPDGLQNIKKQLVEIANVAISIVNAGRSIANYFRSDKKEAIAAFKIDEGGKMVRETNDFRGGRGSITTMAGPAGVFRLNPMDSVMATTNPIPVNDFSSGPAGSMGGTQKIEVTGQLTGTRGALMATIESPLG
jgi:hypothetical protein